MAEVQERNFFEIEGPKPDVNYPIKVRYCGGTNFTIQRILPIKLTIEGMHSFILSLCIVHTCVIFTCRLIYDIHV